MTEKQQAAPKGPPPIGTIYRTERYTDQRGIRILDVKTKHIEGFTIEAPQRAFMGMVHIPMSDGSSEACYFPIPVATTATVTEAFEAFDAAFDSYARVRQQQELRAQLASGARAQITPP